MNSIPWFQINDAPTRLLDGTGVAAYVSGFDAEGVVGKADAGFDDVVENSGRTP